MSTSKRHGKRWTVSELISLQREYELLEWDIHQIAKKHDRSDTSILYKLEAEGLVASWSEARGFDSETYKNNISSFIQNDEAININYDLADDDDEIDIDAEADDEYQFEEDIDDDECDDDDDDCDDFEKLSERVWSLETSVNEISSMVKDIFKLVSSKTKKAKPLRKFTSI